MIEKLNWDEQPENAAKEVQNLIDRLVDAVNELHEEAENNARIRANHENLIDALVEENNIHEKQIDELQMKTEGKDLSDKIGKLESELDRTRKALDVARHTIGWINQMIDEHTDKQAIKIKCEYAINEITTLEQKN